MSIEFDQQKGQQVYTVYNKQKHWKAMALKYTIQVFNDLSYDAFWESIDMKNIFPLARELFYSLDSNGR